MTVDDVAGYLLDTHGVSDEQAQKMATWIHRKLNFGPMWEQVDILFSVSKEDE